MLTLESAVTDIPGVGKTLEKQLYKLGIRYAQDLLFYFPFRYIDFSKFSNIAQAKDGETVTLKATVKTIKARFSFRSRTSLAEGIVSDTTGSMKVMWFNQPYIAKAIQPGDEVYVSGTVDNYKGLQLSNPIIEKVSDDTTHTARIVPVYRVTEGLTPRQLRTIIKKVLYLASEAEELLPDFIKQNYNLLGIPETIEQIHFPESPEVLKQAQSRMIFSEVLVEQLAVERHKQLLSKAKAPRIKTDVALTKSFLETLPFALTNSQKKAAWEIMQDMEKPGPMNRLLQGDVGSGKTLVALLAIMQALHSGYQAVLLAPTEILARQHYDSIMNYLHGRSDAIALLTNSFAAIDNATSKKSDVQQALKQGSISLAVGTHSLIQDGIKFKKLGLVIIDEQHRFGVEQRSFLLKNTKRGSTIPHLLSMSATPIPRTLALSVYGDLAISTLTELPQGRQKIVTSVVPEQKRLAAYGFIKKEIAAGRQVFIITPRVEETGTSDVKSVKAEFKRLSEKIFPNLKLGLLYGKMKGKDKDDVMNGFNNGTLDILVATSVIEIGIDVPNATVMVIEGAERFGLAQLHQLRGRVGRGAHKSYCLLFPTDEDSNALERLQLFAQSSDGFKLAEIDLKQRGFGSLFGTNQTGFSFRFAQYLSLKVLKEANQAAKDLIKTDETLASYPLLKQKSDPFLEKIHLE